MLLDTVQGAKGLECKCEVQQLLPIQGLFFFVDPIYENGLHHRLVEI